jgi:hypothetical protein
MNDTCRQLVTPAKFPFCGGLLGRLRRRRHDWRMVGRRFDPIPVLRIARWELRFECARCGMRNTMTIPREMFWVLDLEVPERSEQEATPS